MRARRYGLELVVRVLAGVPLDPDDRHLVARLALRGLSHRPVTLGAHVALVTHPRPHPRTVMR